MNEWPRKSTVQPVVSENMLSDQLPLAIESGVDRESLCAHIERTLNLADTICKYYRKDPTFAKVLANPEAHPRFGIKDGLIWTKNQMKKDVVCLPWKAFLQGRRLVEVIINHAHTTIGHFGQLGTSCYICHYYWWPTMATHIELFCSSCPSAKSRRIPLSDLPGCYTCCKSQTSHGNQ